MREVWQKIASFSHILDVITISKLSRNHRAYVSNIIMRKAYSVLTNTKTRVRVCFSCNSFCTKYCEHCKYPLCSEHSKQNMCKICDICPKCKAHGRKIGFNGKLACGMCGTKCVSCGGEKISSILIFKYPEPIFKCFSCALMKHDDDCEYDENTWLRNKKCCGTVYSKDCASCKLIYIAPSKEQLEMAILQNVYIDDVCNRCVVDRLSCFCGDRLVDMCQSCYVPICDKHIITKFDLFFCLDCGKK